MTVKWCNLLRNAREKALAQGDALFPDFREWNHAAVQAFGDPEHGKACLTVIIDEQGIPENRTVDDGIIRNLAGKREIKRVGYDTRRKHFFSSDQFILKPVDNKLRPGQLFGFDDLCSSFRVAYAELVRGCYKQDPVRQAS